MEKPEAAAQKASLNDYLAAERTLLAWIRTGLAMMGFGFVVARFGLFLQELHVVQNSAATQQYGPSLWFGTALIGVGVLVNFVAGLRHLRLIRQLDRGETPHSHATAQAVTVAFLLAVLGLAMAIYLISVRGTAQTSSETKKEVSMSLPSNSGIVQISGRHTVDETVQKLKEILQAKGGDVVCRCGSQRRGSEGRHADAEHEADDLRESEGGDTGDAGSAESRD